MKNYSVLHKFTLLLCLSSAFAVLSAQQIGISKNIQRSTTSKHLEEIIAAKEQSMKMKKKQPYASAVVVTNSGESKKTDRYDTTQSCSTVAQVSFQTINDSVNNKYIPSKNKVIKISK